MYITTFREGGFISLNKGLEARVAVILDNPLQFEISKVSL
jgi:hypothetical protein